MKKKVKNEQYYRITPGVFLVIVIVMFFSFVFGLMWGTIIVQSTEDIYGEFDHTSGIISIHTFKCEGDTLCLDRVYRHELMHYKIYTGEIVVKEDICDYYKKLNPVLRGYDCGEVYAYSAEYMN